MMRWTAAAFILPAIVLSSVPALADTPVAEFSQLELHSSFWQNLHHFLYASAWDRRPATAASPRQATALPKTPVVTLTGAEKAAWDAAVDYYDSDLAGKDLLFGFGMTEIKTALGDADDNLSPSPELQEPLRKILVSVAPIYRRHWWPEHDAANRAWIADVQRRTTPVAPAIIQRLTSVYGRSWFTMPVRVDVVRVANWQGAYTSIQPRVHIVLASSDPTYAEWAGTEMLFHESSHALILNLRRAIDGAAKAAGKDPRDLWHVVLFYISGDVTRQALAEKGIDYKPYLYSTGLFERAWPAFRKPIETQVRPFIDGQKTLDQMVNGLVAMLP